MDKEYVVALKDAVTGVLHGGGGTFRILIDEERSGAKHFSCLVNTMNKGVKGAAHKHDVEHLWYILSGRGTMYIGDKVYELAPQMAVFAPAGVMHSIDVAPEEDLTYVLVYAPPGPEQLLKKHGAGLLTPGKIMGKKRVGLIGVGLMGSGMAGNLLAAGFPLLVYDIDPHKVAALVASGAQTVRSPDELPAQVDVIMTSLPNSRIVDDVIRDALRLWETGRRGLIFIDTTTADPFTSAAQAAALAEKGIAMLDAALGGTSSMCARKEISVMVGGEETVFESCRDIFEAIARNIFYIGKNGAGAMMKLVHNLVLGLNRMALAEGLTFARKAGMDARRVLEVLRQTPAYSAAMDMKGARMVDGRFLPAEGKLGFHLKDVRYILDVGARLNLPLPLSSLHAQALTSEVAKGHEEWDNAAIAAFYESLAALGNEDGK